MTSFETILFKVDLRPKLHPFLGHIFVKFIEKEPSTKFCVVLISFKEVMKLQSFEFDASDVIPANALNILPTFFHIFVNFMENELSTKSYSVFDVFSGTY